MLMAVFFFLKKKKKLQGLAKPLQSRQFGKWSFLQGSLGPAVICSPQLQTAPPHGFSWLLFLQHHLQTYRDQYGIVFTVAGNWVIRVYPDRFSEAVPDPVLTPSHVLRYSRS